MSGSRTKPSMNDDRSTPSMTAYNFSPGTTGGVFAPARPTSFTPGSKSTPSTLGSMFTPAMAYSPLTPGTAGGRSAFSPPSRSGSIFTPGMTGGEPTPGMTRGISTRGSSLNNMTHLNVPDPPNVTPDDIVIAIMGITGCGKTTFVNHFSDYPLTIGHGLDSCTQIVQVVPCTLENGKKIYLVDTPGFDDSMRSDTEILRELAAWLNQAHISKIKLTGLILLHRITDVRVGGSGVRNIRMFKRLCGDDTLSSVVLATTMWRHITDEETGRNREAELYREPVLWKAMIDQGSKVFRQDKGKASAMRIIQYLIDTKRPVTLDIQREMVDQKKQLGETGAGSAIASEVEKLKQFYDKKLRELDIQLQDALSKQDHERKEDIEEAKLEFQLKLTQRQEELDKLKADTEQLHEEMKTRYEKDVQEMMKKMHQRELEIQESQMQITMLKEAHIHNLELQKLQERMRMKDKYIKMLYSPTKCTVM